MKLLGQSNIGEPIVQLSQAEYKRLVALEKVAAGATLDAAMSYPDSDVVSDVDLSEALKFVVAWIQVKDKANQLRQMAATIDFEMTR